MSFGKELVESAREALAIAEGKAEPAGAFIPEKADATASGEKRERSQADGSDRDRLTTGT